MSSRRRCRLFFPLVAEVYAATIESGAECAKASSFSEWLSALLNTEQDSSQAAEKSV